MRHSTIWIKRHHHSATKSLHNVRGKRRGEGTMWERLRYVPQYTCLHSPRCYQYCWKHIADTVLLQSTSEVQTCHTGSSDFPRPLFTLNSNPLLPLHRSHLTSPHPRRDTLLHPTHGSKKPRRRSAALTHTPFALLADPAIKPPISKTPIIYAIRPMPCLRLKHMRGLGEKRSNQEPADSDDGGATRW